MTTFTRYPLELDELDEALGEEVGTDAIRIEAIRTVALFTLALTAEALRTLAPLTEADAIELTGIVALKL